MSTLAYFECRDPIIQSLEFIAHSKGILYRTAAKTL